MFNRNDQGVDLQYPGTKPVPVRAIAAGNVFTASDPNGFGTQYPIIALDHPIAGQYGVYYGHITPAQNVIGKHVKAGQIIGYTGGAHSGGDAANLPNWLEVGFWSSNGPSGYGVTSPEMRALLKKAKTYNQQIHVLPHRGGVGWLPPARPTPGYNYSLNPGKIASLSRISPGSNPIKHKVTHHKPHHKIVHHHPIPHPHAGPQPAIHTMAYQKHVSHHPRPKPIVRRMGGHTV